MGLFDSIKKAFNNTVSNVSNGLKSACNCIANVATSTYNSVADKAKETYNSAAKEVTNAYNGAVTGVTNGANTAINAVGKAVDRAQNGIDNAKNSATTTANKVGNSANRFFTNWWGNFNNFGVSIPGRWDSFSQNTIKWADKQGDAIGDFAEDTAKDTAKWAVDTFTSSIVIRNPSPVKWQCRIGPDQDTLKVAGIVVQAVSLTLTAVSLAGIASVPMVIGMSVTAAGYGVSIAGGKATTIDTVNKYAQRLTGKRNSFTVKGAAKSVADILNVDYITGWKTVAPNGEARFDKLTLSLLQWGTCITSYVNPFSPQRVITETITLKDLWSGPTKGSANNYNIPNCYWQNGAKRMVTAFNLFSGPLGRR